MYRPHLCNFRVGFCRQHVYRQKRRHALFDKPPLRAYGCRASNCEQSFGKRCASSGAKIDNSVGRYNECGCIERRTGKKGERARFRNRKKCGNLYRSKRRYALFDRAEIRYKIIRSAFDKQYGKRCRDQSRAAYKSARKIRSCRKKSSEQCFIR